VGVFLIKPESISTTPDPLDYRLAAIQILDNQHFSFAAPEFDAPQLLRTPLYPALLAGTYLLDGRTGLVMILIQSLSLVLMAFLLFRILIRLRVPDNIALLLTTLYLFEPLQWLYSLHTMTETFSSLVLLVLVYLVIVPSSIRGKCLSALFGVGLAVIVLMKPSGTMWIPFMLMMLGAIPGSFHERMKRLLIACFFLVLVLSPWVIRNYNLTGYPVISSSGPFNFILFAGTSETQPDEYWDVVTMASYNGHSNQVWYAYTTNAYPMLLETQKTILEKADMTSLIMRQIAYAPVVWFGFLTKHNEESYGHAYGMIATFIFGDLGSRYAGTLLILDVMFWSVALVLFLYGSVLLARLKDIRWLYLPLFGMVAATVFINFQASWVRVMLPMYPILAIAAGIALARIFAYFQFKGTHAKVRP
tara:strand:+ start:583170 stop:584423 length:1254 start_codon:yes stop_codon:yes gene_type:complete